MVQQHRVGPLVEGAFLALMTGIMGALAIYFLPVKFLVDYIWGIPIIIIIKRYDLRMGLLTLAITFFITWILTEPVTTLLLIVELAPLALAYGLMFKNEISPGFTLLGGSLISIVSTILTVLGFLYLANISIVPAEETLLMQTEKSLAFYKKLGLINNQDTKEIMETTVRLMLLLIPSALAIVSVIRAFFTYIIAVRVLRKLNYTVNPLPPFGEWRLPWYSVWAVILGLGMTLAGDFYNFNIMAVIGKNMVFIILPVYFTIGLAVATNFYKAWTLPKWGKILLIIAAVINLTGTVFILTLIGLFDPLVSFRNWKKPKD